MHARLGATTDRASCASSRRTRSGSPSEIPLLQEEPGRTPSARTASTPRRTRLTASRWLPARPARSGTCGCGRVDPAIPLAVARLGPHVDDAGSGGMGPHADHDVVLEAEDGARGHGLQLARLRVATRYRPVGHGGRHAVDHGEGGGRIEREALRGEIGAAAALHLGERLRVAHVPPDVGLGRRPA